MSTERKTKKMNPEDREKGFFSNYMWIDESDYGAQRGSLLRRANRRKEAALKTQTNLGNPKGLRDLENNSGKVTKLQKANFKGTKPDISNARKVLESEFKKRKGK